MSGLNRMAGADLFYATPGKSVLCAATAVSANFAIPTRADGSVAEIIRISNGGTSAVMFRYGTVAQAAATSDEMLPSGQSITRRSNGATNIAFICPGAGTATASVSAGEGTA
jgi:hypothetical protein